MFSYNLTDILKNLENLLVNSIKECLNENLNVGVVLSGGVDSTTIAFVLKKIYKNFILYTCGSKNSEDVKIVKKLISEINDSSLNFKIIEIDEEKIKENLENLRKILRENNIPENKLNISTGIPIYFISKEAKKDKINLLLSGQGGDEIFGGYYRYLKMINNKDELIKCMQKDVENAYIDNLNREIYIAKYFGIKIAYPYLNKEFLNYSLNLPIDLKIHELEDNEIDEFKDCIDEIYGRKFIRKYILRKFAAYIGVPEFIVKRKKKALQYGSMSEKMIKKIMKFPSH